MGVFLPASPNYPAVRLMKELACSFKTNKKEVILKFENLCDNKKDNSDLMGVRYINGGRYKLFLGAKGKATAAIEWAMVKALEENELPKAVHLLTEWKHQQLLLLINYANSMAKNDPRVSTADYVMGNHGLIVSYGVVHIDLWHPKQFQFGMMFSDKCKGTVEYETIGPDFKRG